MGLTQSKVFISQLEATVGVQDPSEVLSLSQGQLLSSKAASWVDTPQLTITARTGTSEAKKQG